MAIKIPRDTIPAVQLPSTSSLGVASNNPISASMDKLTSLFDTLAVRKAENDRRIEAQRILNKNTTNKSLLEKSKNEFLQKIEENKEILTKEGYNILLKDWVISSTKGLPIETGFSERSFCLNKGSFIEETFSLSDFLDNS